QIVGMDWHPVLKQLYFTENQRDWLSGTYRRKSSTASPVPARTISAFPTAIKETSPISSSAGVTIAPRSSPNRSRCSDHIQPRSACASTPGTCLPREYHNAIFIARHGSWNKTKKIGGDIVVAKLNSNGSVKSIEPFITGFIV